MTTVDARGLLCPLPLTMAKREMARLAPGDVLVVLATDPEAPIDLGAWAASEGHGLSRRDRGGWIEFELVKQRASRPGPPRRPAAGRRRR